MQTSFCVLVSIIERMPTWNDIKARNPQHSHNYAKRWENLEAEGNDINGEARLIDALVQRGSKILDAGCGQGRVGGYLSARGHIVTGIDIDDYLISEAEKKFPGATWHVGDLGGESIPDQGFDIAVCAGNVITFIEPNKQEAALAHIFEALRPNGRCIIGFGAGRGYVFPQFFEDARNVGFVIENNFESWDLNPMTDRSQFLVAFLRKPE
ncbi:class I SAM-dependent methyltransferase [Corynebacterium diphtheriae]|nr:class I SAM-dependent methyltransferase [Corynebacterium diphtheriae]CAB0698584.1 class I SAM-dependent methyltransferase [Corynebacterium diphtheriae]CAB0880494.1 class I SAM-dependent methyltransferase [Corynebacterium diphtheriae]CAB0993323.1 class I SAM-dependent methyltransferase [Corynebacterium diphtheriae]